MGKQATAKCTSCCNLFHILAPQSEHPETHKGPPPLLRFSLIEIIRLYISMLILILNFLTFIRQMLFLSAHYLEYQREIFTIFTYWHHKGSIQRSKKTQFEIDGLKEGFCIQFFRPKTRPKTFLQCFALAQREPKAKHCRNVLGRVLGRINQIQKLS